MNYVKAFVSRYVNEPTILGWELANEPRCRGSTGWVYYESRTSWNSGAEHPCCEQDDLWRMYYIDNHKMGHGNFSVHQVD